MTKTFATLAIAATLAVATIAAPKPAEARCWGCAVGAGVLAGAVIGTAIANSGPYYGGYYGYGPVYGPPCYFTTERYFDGFSWRFLRVRVCG